jgi:RimJ/RimL family protein N-acetyltransferase
MTMSLIACHNELIPTMRELRATSGPEIDAQDRLPRLEGRHVTLRALDLSDAASLHAFLTTPEVARFINPPPATVGGFERFITRSLRQQGSANHICFATTLKGNDTALGLFQMRGAETGFSTAEWGFALGSPFWGTGVFVEAAQLTLEFAFNTLGVHRLEARSAVRNGRGGRALQKIGGVQEGVLRRSFVRNGEYLDQVLYAILEDDWRAACAASAQSAHMVTLH